jgi:hypothetical protein
MDGKVQSWDTGITKDLIDMVNQVLREGSGASPAYVQGGYVFCAAIHDWMEKLVTEGVTREMIANLNTELEEVRFQHVLSQGPSGKTKWKYIGDFQGGLDPDAAAAYGFSHLLQAGALDGLKRCQLEDCENFFIGRPNAKWCSARCGSLHRVRAKRKRDM